MKVVPESDCEDSYWRWTGTGLARYGEEGGGCLTSLGGQDKTVLRPCDDTREDQMLEFAVESGQDLIPISLEFWNERMEKRRTEELEISFMDIQKVLEEIKVMNSTGRLSQNTGKALALYSSHESVRHSFALTL